MDSILAGYDGGAHGLFSSDPVVNPMFANATKAYVRYCVSAAPLRLISSLPTHGPSPSLLGCRLLQDGASFSGDLSAPATAGDQKLFFRGHRILDVVLDSFLSSGLSKAKTLIVNGCSAGGLSTYLHLDYIRSRVPATVK